MRSNTEMFERGVADAEQDDLNLFYYQHYYHYRRGYDHARRQLRHLHDTAAGTFSVPRLLLVFAGVALGMLLLVFGLPWLQQNVGNGSQAGDETGQLLTASEQTPTRTPFPTAAPTITPTATLTPTVPPTPAPVLRVSGQAEVVNVGEAPLRARSAPGINAPIQASFPEGTQVTLEEGPVEVDGYTWWYLSDETGSGWSAASSTEGEVWLRALP